MISYFVDKDQIEFKLQNVSNPIFIVDNKAPKLSIFDNYPSYYIKASEKNKSYNTILKLIDFALENKVDRNNSVVVYGGGITLDLGAFFASIFKRGINNLILIPTTLLSLTDASLGGKTGFNYKGYKNLIGSFRSCDELYVCPSLCKTQESSLLRDSLSETVKHAFLSSDDELLNLLESISYEEIFKDDNLFLDIVKKSLKVKEEYIKLDPTETKNIRTCLNLGHTLAHAIETTTNNSITHARAVYYGLLFIVRFSYKLNNSNYCLRAEKLILKYFDNSILKLENNKILDIMKYDKKQRNINTIHLKLLKDQGEVYSYEATPNQILEFLNL